MYGNAGAGKKSVLSGQKSILVVKSFLFSNEGETGVLPPRRRWIAVDSPFRHICSDGIDKNRKTGPQTDSWEYF
jgi:hypothetical protein